VAEKCEYAGSLQASGHHQKEVDQTTTAQTT
jgi:hypothetical protein